MLYRYQDGERRPGQTIQLRLAHLTDVVGTLRTARNDHAIVRWVTEVRADGIQLTALLPGCWRQFRDLLAADRVANLSDPLPTR